MNVNNNNSPNNGHRRARKTPAERKRSARACAPCKSSKKRCDANLPCSLCVTKGRVNLCVYPQPPHSPPQEGGLLSPRASVAGGQSQQQQQQQQLESTPICRPRRLGDSLRESTVGTRESTPQFSQRPTMLLSSRGEQVYIGNVAALSFLQFLQKTLKRYIGPSIFTDRQPNATMLEAEIQNGGIGMFEDEVDDNERRELVQCFLRVSNGILHLFSRSEIEKLLGFGSQAQSSESIDLSLHPLREELASLYLMMAIGAQCRGRNDVDLHRATRYFAQARSMAFVDMLQDPSINMIRNFLLMSMYLLGACRRNAAFMYIGIASKASLILGLHMPHYHVRLSIDDRAVRRRIWMSLRVMDLICSSILAQPSSVPSMKRDEYETEKFNDEDKEHRTLALRANYESSSIIEAIVQSFAQSSTLDIKSTESYLQMLREWSQALPEALRNSPKSPRDIPPLETDAREVTIGNIHVSCTYYFGVILVTRQFLITHIMSQLRGRRSGGATRTDQDSPEAVEEREKSSQFSEGCISSATYMAQLCYEASKRDILLGNMCILQAWLFSAGLVLGFSLLMEGEDRPNTNEAFTNVRETLQKLAQLSPQAKQYYDILTNFSTAIEHYRQHLLAQQKQASNPYVEKIMTIGVVEDVRDNMTWGSTDLGQNTGLMNQAAATDSYAGEGMSEMVFEPGFQQDLGEFAMPLGQDIGLQLLWDTYNLQLPSFVNFEEDDDIG